MTTERPDRGARALAERLDGIGAGPDGCEFSPVLDVDTGRMDDLHHGPEYADAILANGAVFLERGDDLRLLVDAILGGTSYLPHREAADRLRAALEPEGSAQG